MPRRPWRDLPRHRAPVTPAFRSGSWGPERLHDHGPGRRRGPDAALRARSSATRNAKKALPAKRRRCTTSTRGTSTPRSRSTTSCARSTRSSSTTTTTSCRIFADYTRRKAERNLVDYDDLLVFWAAMLEQRRPIAERIAALYDHVLVDEYQDTNVLQARILRGMCRRTATSPSSATTRRASIRSAARASATSSISRGSFPARRSSRWSRTTARRSRSSTPATR